MKAAKHREIEEQKETKEEGNVLILKPDDPLRKNLAGLATDLQSYILTFLFAIKIVRGLPPGMTNEVLSVVCNGSKMSDEIDEKAVVPASNKLKWFKPVYGINGAIPTFFSNYLVLYKEPIRQMIHNLLFHINVEETLTAFAALSSEDQLTAVELKDPHGQRIRGMAGEIVEAAGDHALGIRLRDCYKNQEEYDKRLAKWFYVGCDLFLMSCHSPEALSDTVKQNAENKKTPILIRVNNKFYIYGCLKEGKNWELNLIEPSSPEVTAHLSNLPFDEGIIQRGDDRFNKILVDTLKPGHALVEGSKDATEKIMAPYRKAIETICQEIIEWKDISNNISDNAAFEGLLDLPIAKKFRKALNPDPNHVVTSGFLFDLQIFLDFISIFKANVNNDEIQNKSRPNLGGWWSLKSDLFDAIVYRALQARTQRNDQEKFKKGIGSVSMGEIPDPIDFSKDVLTEFNGFGKTYYFDYLGNKRDGRYPGSRGNGGADLAQHIFQQLRKEKTSHLESHNPNKITNRRGVR